MDSISSTGDKSPAESINVLQAMDLQMRNKEDVISPYINYQKAVIATAHKLIRTIFAMLSNKSFFNAAAN
jgi:hypothetical protein